MATDLSIAFSKPDLPSKGTLVVLRDANGRHAPLPAELDATLLRAAGAAKFEGGFGKTIELLAPADSELDRVVVLGLGEVSKLEPGAWRKLGGKAAAALEGVEKGGRAAVSLALPEGDVAPEDAADFAAGLMLRLYLFDRYKTRKRKDAKLSVSLLVENAAAARKAWARARAVAEGTLLARDLVNEPANVLTPKAFAKRASALEEAGVEVTVLKREDMERLEMHALLGVARGSRNAPRLVLMEWMGGKKGDKPVAFVGKGVTFDSGGISIKPSSGMEDMKGDMGGAAAVTGLMHALAHRKAPVNAVGVIVLVENMPDGDAQRPGDVVTSMSGQTIEIINTDAEGRLVLADAMWHTQKVYEPRMVIDLATLTGAIMVALGHFRAGLFSNDDALADQLLAAGEASGERVWRMPLAPEYDKLIDTKNADMKNTGGRLAGSVTAAQFLQRFVRNGTPWAHLDIAGAAMGAPADDVNQSWGSGFGVQLLDRLVRDGYEG